MAVALRFTKMQGIGNDYVYINGFQERIDSPGDLARKISDRHFGIGSAYFAISDGRCAHAYVQC